MLRCEVAMGIGFGLETSETLKRLKPCTLVLAPSRKCMTYGNIDAITCDAIIALSAQVKWVWANVARGEECLLRGY